MRIRKSREVEFQMEKERRKVWGYLGCDEVTTSPLRRKGDGLLGPLGSRNSSHGGRIGRIVEGGGGGGRVERFHTDLRRCQWWF